MDRSVLPLTKACGITYHICKGLIYIRNISTSWRVYTSLTFFSLALLVQVYSLTLYPSRWGSLRPTPLTCILNNLLPLSAIRSYLDCGSIGWLTASPASRSLILAKVSFNRPSCFILKLYHQNVI